MAVWQHLRENQERGLGEEKCLLSEGQFEFGLESRQGNIRILLLPLHRLLALILERDGRHHDIPLFLMLVLNTNLVIF